ncbi:mite allergen Der p 3-like [Thrips palmi]|uniref:Mite allergen Der p 3-like n=1 Tax=Thrips palmi TaxID=161013 RepID=A0A6P9A2J2_THRPL|nr:mite allergen Der p 3-like [Thrips palmi]
MLFKYCVFVALAWAAQVIVAEHAVLNLRGHKRGHKSAAAVAAGLGSMKIVGGLSTSIVKRAFMANVGIAKGNTFTPQCGGTILDKRHILSAAHCFKDRKVTYRVRVGSSQWASGGQLVDVTKIYVPSQYNKAAAYDYDVAVLRVSKDLVLGQAVKAVTLVPVGQKVVANTEITLIGWGYTDALHSEPLPSALREVKIETIDQTECEDDYSGFDLTVTDRMLCGMRAEKDSCQGDSGGPVFNDKTGQQMGIISWGMGCAQMGSRESSPTWRTATSGTSSPRPRRTRREAARRGRGACTR